MKKFWGFTLSELMIAITILGILCATVLPAVLGNNPNQNKMMIKKAYYTASEIISELINNPNLYPDKTDACTTSTSDSDCYVGFDYTTAVNYEGQSQYTDKCKYSSNNKFPCLFASQLNIDEDIETGSTDGITLTTTDGIEWNFKGISGWTQGDVDSYEYIYVDVNGDKKPNCRQSNSSASSSCKSRTKNFDQFIIIVYADGKTEINPDDEWAAEALQVSSSLSED